MSMTWEINSGTNDITVKNGVLVKTTGADEVIQRVRVTLRHFWGEYWLNLEGGIPWYEIVLGAKNVKLAEAIIRKTMLSVPGVVSIVQFQKAFQNRALRINAQLEVETATGTTIVGFTE